MAENSEVEKFPIVEVTWVDSMVLNGGEWMDVDEADELMEDENALLHKSAGYRVRENEHTLILASSQNDQEGQDKRVQGCVVIPKRAILKMETFPHA